MPRGIPQTPEQRVISIAERQRKYALTEKGMATKLRASTKYEQSEKGRTTRISHRLSAQRREAQFKYNHSPKAKLCRDKYAKTPAYKTAIRKFHGRPTPTRPCSDFCECCGGPPNGSGKLHEDHDHITGKFRGWLCGKCNAGIGFLSDCADGVAKALTYLNRSEDSVDV